MLLCRTLVKGGARKRCCAELWLRAGLVSAVVQNFG